MTPLQFLSAVWPDKGLYCIALPIKKGFSHKIFETIGAAAKCAESLNKTNVYFAVHSMREERVWSKRKVAFEFRTQKNALAAKCLFFDLDIEPGSVEKYPTREAAIIDLKKFCKETGLPKPMIVSSGAGIHIYWLFDAPVGSHDAWLTMAQRLRQLATYHKLKFDPTRTTDQASVLRVVGTWNVKRQAPVELITNGAISTAEWFGKVLVGALDDIDETPTPERVAQAALDELGSNTGKVYDKPLPDPSALSVLKACGQMRRIAHAKGNIPEPQWWNGCIGVMKFTKEGRAAVHKISSGHPNYTEAETDAKIDQWQDGPSSCMNLEQKCGPKYASICKGCKFYPQNKSPIHAGRLEDTIPAPVVRPIKPVTLAGIEVESVFKIPNPPNPYKRTKDGVQIEKSGKDKTGSFLSEVYPHDLYPIARNTNPERETEQQTWRVHLPTEGIKEFTIEATSFVDTKALETRLANIGVYCSQFPELKAYMSAYIQELQKLNAVVQQHNHLGWTATDSFVLPSKMFTPNDRPRMVSLGKTAADAKDYVGTKGTLEKQIELMQFFDDPRYVATQYYILSALGSILFRFTGHAGVIVHATGDTGAGKSTAIEAAGLLFGPKHYTLNCTGQGATPLYRTNRLEVLNNLPLCLDEITHIAEDVAKDFTMNATQSTGRRGMKPDGTSREATTADRASITLSTANRSLHAILAVDNSAGAATAVRVFEIHFRKMGVHTTMQAEAVLMGLRQNYGHIGEQFIGYVVDHQDELAKRVPEVMARMEITANMSREERFWRANIACALLAGAICRSLGLLSWSVKTIETWLVGEQLPFLRGQLREEMSGKSSLSTLMTYIERINGAIIKTERLHSKVNPTDLPHGEMLAHFDKTAKVIYVLKDAFRQWCEKRGQYSQAILKELNASGVVPIISAFRVLGADTLHAKGKSPVFMVNMDHKDMAGTKTLKIVTSVAPVGKAKP